MNDNKANATAHNASIVTTNSVHAEIHQAIDDGDLTKAIRLLANELLQPPATQQ